jgi:hypothetical protein
MERAGITPSTFLRDIAERYGITFETARQDWGRRSIWMPKLRKIEELEGIVEAFRQDCMMVRREAWRLYYTAEQERVKVNALGIVLQSWEEELKYLQRMGVLRRPP